MPIADKTIKAPGLDHGDGHQSEKDASVSGRPVSAVELEFDYDEFEIAVEDRAVLEDVRTFFVSVGRKRTDEIFECGAALAKVEARLPDQKAFDVWTRKACRITRRGAANYIGVYRNLSKHRDRFVAQSVPGSAMYKLIAAEPSVIDTVLSSYESGRPLTVNDIGRMMSSGSDPTVDDGDIGGREGLRRMIARKTAKEVPMMMETAVGVTAILLAGLEPTYRGKRIEKTALNRRVYLPARVLRQHIEWLTWVGVEEGPFETVVANLLPISRTDRWFQLWRIAERLGGLESWPSAGEVKGWLEKEVLPLLEWLLGSDMERARSEAKVIAARLEVEAQEAKLEAKAARAAAKASASLTREAA